MCVDTRGLCAQQWFGWAMNVPGNRSSGAALCCARIHQRWWAQRLPIVVPCALVVAEPWVWLVQDERQGETRLRFELRGQSAPSGTHCCVRMRIRCTRVPIPVATRVRS